MALQSIFLSPDELIKSDNLFPVVGIGASAGGLEAFRKLISAIPQDSGMAYVLVQHLDPNHESLLPQLLQKMTGLPVIEITDDIRVRPDHIYIIPSNRMLIATDGVLKLSPRLPKSDTKLNLPIDLFFASLSEIHQSHAIGVVLSGTASDGTAGLKAIKEKGGLTFAQDTESAAYDGMLLSAINAGVVDYILPPEEIPERILKAVQEKKSDSSHKPGTDHIENLAYSKILNTLRANKGTDFTYYKQTTIRRRILRRMVIAGKKSAVEYGELLEASFAEQEALYYDLLIPVTSFFRDRKIFDHLCTSVFPDIVKNNIPGEPVRVWIAGCSTGQEAYSVAICLREIIGTQNKNIQIFATDVSENAILKARTGIYSQSEVRGMLPHRVAEYFTKIGDEYQVTKKVRDMCVFAVHNFLKDPPFGNMDFIACRNVLIYMEPYLQKKALTTFHYALRPKGVLLLGKSETHGLPEHFEASDKANKIFIRRNAPSRFMHVASIRQEQRQFENNATPDVNINDFSRNANDVLLRWFMPSGVIINEFMDIVEYRGETQNYLIQTPGKPSHNLLKLARTELSFELRHLLLRARKENKPIRKDGISIVAGNKKRMLDLEAIPLPNMADPHFLVLFHEKPVEINADSSKPTADDKRDNRILQLEMELALIREDMRAVTDEYESTNDALQRVNEELLSGSEELQSLNEELETSKEELQSSNEELIVMNQEMAGLHEETIMARDYAESIIATIREPLVVLDKKLIVRSANSAFYKTFGLTAEQTEGFSIIKLGDSQWASSLKTLFSVLPSDKQLVNYEVKYNIPGKGERCMLLNAREIERSKEDNLILLIIEDITERAQLQQSKTELLKRFRDLVTQAPVAICILGADDYKIEIANKTYSEIVGIADEIVGRNLFELVPKLLVQGVRERLDQVMKSGSRFEAKEMMLDFGKTPRHDSFYNIVYQPIHELGANATGIIMVINDVTEQVEARKIMEVQAAMVQELLMTAPGFVCTLEGPKHIYGIVNQQYQNLFGKRELIGKPIMAALPELKNQGFDLLLEKVYKTGAPYIGIDVPITLARDTDVEPELRYFNFSYQPMYNVQRRIYAILVFGYEVTDQVNAHLKVVKSQQEHTDELEEKVLQRTQELLESNEDLVRNLSELARKNKELESFNFISSHDLQEPLRKIQMFAGRIIDNEEIALLSEAGKNHFLRIQAAAWRMQTLLEDLLSYSRAGITEHTFKKIDLNNVVSEVLDELAENIIELKATVIVGDLCHADINPSQFRQVLNNIIGNGLKYSKKHVPPEISIRSRPVNGSDMTGLRLENAPYCHISITDNGIGFKDIYKEKIFDVFQRLHSKGDYEGTGIGLAIVKKIIENHNGAVNATSVPGVGTTFNIYVPQRHHENGEMAAI